MSSMASTTVSNVDNTNIVCFCPYCKTGYAWWVKCDCLEQQDDNDDEQKQQQDDNDDDRVVYDLVECKYCGNKWDGFAQCMCWGNLTLDHNGFDINEND